MEKYDEVEEQIFSESLGTFVDNSLGTCVNAQLH